MYQPIEYNDKIIYLSIDTDDGVYITLTDIYTFAVKFSAQSEDEFFSETYRLNNLSKSDTDSTNDIMENIKQIQDKLRPTIQLGLCEVLQDFTSITLTNDIFKYTLPLSKLTPEDELKLIRSIHRELEQFSKLQNGLITSLETQILNKNKIISNLADAYVQRCTYEKIDNVFNSKFISDLFVNRNMLEFAQSTVSDCIEKLQPTSTSSIRNCKNDKLWQLIVQPKKAANQLPIKREITSTQPSTSKTTKRKLQGLLRREQRKKKL